MNEALTFDYIIVGAGSAGCVLANRLSESGKYSVALLESGNSDKHFFVNMPLGVGQMLMNPRFAWQYFTSAEKSLVGQEVYWPRGRMLGGSSSINGMIFVRGEPERYNEWRDEGNSGWGYNDLLPYFKKLEHRPEDTTGTRGKGGPIRSSDITFHDEVSTSFLDGCKSLGIPYNPDYNGEKSDGVSWLQFSIKDGRRCSAAHGYIHPILGRKNLTLFMGASCEKVSLTGNKVTGIEYRVDGQLKQMSARREVILSAGPIITPKILELSGIGNPDILKPLGIEVKHALKGVGENLQDHLQTRMNYQINKPVTVNDLLNNKLRGGFELIKYLITRKGLMACPSATVHALTKSLASAPYADLKLQITLYSAPDRYADAKNDKLTDDFSGVGFGSFLTFPESKGSVHITSKDPNLNPKMNANYFSVESDIQKSMAGMRMMDKIAKTSHMQQHIIARSLPECNIDNDQELIAYMKETGQTSWHPISSCRMGNGENDVVDANLKVHGLEGIRIIDSSIMPNMPSTNTNIPTIMIGEKGAALILASMQ